MNIIKKIKEFFDEPSLEDEIEERFYSKLEDMRKNPEKYYRHILNKSNSNKIPPVSLF